jgi:hypothetical protein
MQMNRPIPPILPVPTILKTIPAEAGPSERPSFSAAVQTPVKQPSAPAPLVRITSPTIVKGKTCNPANVIPANANPISAELHSICANTDMPSATVQMPYAMTEQMSAAVKPIRLPKPDQNGTAIMVATK